MNPAQLLAADAQHVWHPFTQTQTAPTPVLIERAEGAYLYPAQGQPLLDMVSSWWVNLHGHAHPQIAQAIAQQAQQLEHVIFAGFTHQGAVTLAQRLAGHLPTGLTRIFYSDNGSTATEVALKLALQTWFNRGETRQRVLALQGGYHGDTFGAMSAGRTSGFFDPFHKQLFDVTCLPYPATWQDDPEVEAKEQAALDALDAELACYGQQTAAIILEPLLQGSSGMRLVRPQWVEAVVRRVREYGILVIFDEVLTGFYRTGQLWATRHLNVTPDLICLSKGLTGGFLPLGVTATTDALYAEFQGESFDRAFAHGHSYTANPLSCAAALASLDLLETPETLAQIRRIEATHRQALSQLAQHPKLEQVRQLGTMAAVRLRGAGAYGGSISLELRQFFAQRGLLMRPLGDVLYLLPPYCVTDDELHLAYQAIAEAADHFGAA